LEEVHAVRFYRVGPVGAEIFVRIPDSR
jgi:hypothetical protein